MHVLSRTFLLFFFSAAFLPAQVSITIASNPVGAAFTVGGSGCSPGAFITPQTLSWTAGSSCTVAFASPQYPQTGRQYEFAGWQDSAATNPRTIIATGQAATYTANLITSYFLSTAASPTQGGTVSGSGWYVANSTATVTAVPASGYRLLNWTGVTSAMPGTNTATVNMTAAMGVTANFGKVAIPPSSYVVTQIFGNGASADALNNLGQVVGHTPDPARAYLWTPTTANGTTGGVTDLGSLPVNGTPSFIPSSINDQGQVVGRISVFPSNANEAFLWQPAGPNATSGTMLALLGTDNQSAAQGINNFGQIIGSQSSGLATPFIWTPAAANGTTGTLNNDSRLQFPAGINDLGQVIANGQVPAYPAPELFTPSPPHAATGSFTQINAGSTPLLLAINNKGTILVGFGGACAGQCSALNFGRLWIPSSPNASTGTTTDIPLPGGFSFLKATALNSSNQVVGYLGQGNIFVTGLTAFLYSGGIVYDLTAAPGFPSGGMPVAINDKGQIAVTLSNGGAYLLTPVSSAPPTPVSVSPQSGSGASQSMQFTFSDPRGWQDLGVVNILINNFIDGRNACYLAYSVPSSTLYLVNDSGQAGGPYAGSMAPGGSVAIQNSQCIVSLSSANGSGNTLTLTLNITFKTAFAGNKVLYSAARDIAENNSGWQPLGVWQIPGAAPATTTAVVGMTPASGSGLGPTTYNFTFSDTKGYQDLGVENILINTALDGRHACYLAYARQAGMLYLVNDNGDGLLSGQSVSAAGSLNNSQCTVSWALNLVGPSGNNLNLLLNIGFKAGFGPDLVFYLAARDVNEGNNTDWQAMGTWMAQ